jgi:hypothetical protein
VPVHLRKATLTEAFHDDIRFIGLHMPAFAVSSHDRSSTENNGRSSHALHQHQPLGEFTPPLVQGTYIQSTN